MEMKTIERLDGHALMVMLTDAQNYCLSFVPYLDVALNFFLCKETWKFLIYVSYIMSLKNILFQHSSCLILAPNPSFFLIFMFSERNHSKPPSVRLWNSLSMCFVCLKF